MTGRGAVALGAVAVILLVTAAWWALALWPLTSAAPQWLARTRQACFGAAPGGLPDAGGWILLLGEPVGMLSVLAVVWGGALREGLRAAAARRVGRVALAGAALAVVAGLGAAARLVAEVRGEPFSVRTGSDLVGEVAAARVDDPAPDLRLVDQRGDSVILERFRGQPVVVTFGYGHCETVCPLTVHAARDAVRRLTDQGATLVIVTLDPWRDTPSRLPYLADGWGLSVGMHLVGGDVATVERTLSAWLMPRVRNEVTGDLSHPAIVYVVSAAGRLAYALGPDSDAIVAAVRALAGS